MADRILPPKIKELTEKPYIKKVDEMLDRGLSIRKVNAFIKEQNDGFEISNPYLNKYNQYRKAKGLEESKLDNFISNSTVTKIMLSEDTKSPITKRDQLKKDLEFIDLVIQTGAKDLREKIQRNEADIEIDDVFTAIKLKDKLTDGAFSGLTDYGIEYLQSITEEKYMNLIKLMYRYIPDEDKEKVLEEMQQCEELFYKNTDYYEDYLIAQGYSNEEIRKRIYEEELNKSNNTKTHRRK